MDRTGPDPGRKNDVSFETARLTVEPPRPEDAPILFDLVGGEYRNEVTATLRWDGPEHISETKSWIENNRTKTYGDYGFHWTIRDKTGVFTDSPGTPLGAIGTRPRDEPGRADVGYWLGRPYWGQGIMSEALKELLRIAFNELSNYKIEADVYTVNSRGLRLVEGVGMKREGLVTKAYRKRDGFVDMCIYGIHYDDWLTANTSDG